MISEYIYENGFNNIATFVCGEDGKPFVYNEGGLFALVNEFEGERYELTQRDNAIEFARLLADFHKQSEGFIKPTGARVKVEWGKTIEKYKTLSRKLERYMKALNQRGANNKFEEETLDYLEPILNRAYRSVKVFKSMGYLKALEKSMLNKEICINAFSDNTAIITPDRNIIIKDVFNLSYNMTLEDLSELIKKGSDKNDVKDIYSNVIKNYSKVRHLDENSKIIIAAIINFPYDSMKILNRYICSKSDEESLLEKFKKYYEREQRVNIWG